MFGSVATGGREANGHADDIGARSMTRSEIDPRRLDAMIFALEDVVVDTAAIRSVVWSDALGDFSSHPAPFTGDDYRRFVDGVSHVDAVASVLSSRGIDLPRGAPSDSTTEETVWGFANRVEESFRTHIMRERVPVFDSAVELVRRLQSAGVRTAAVSSSPDAEQILEAAGVGGLFPSPPARMRDANGWAALVETARALGASPSRTGVVHGTRAGVRASRQDGFALVIGVDCTGEVERLRGAGADVVVSDLSRVEFRGGTHRLSDIPDALTSRHQSAAILRTRQPAVFLDFDGTVAEIVNDPAAAQLVDGVATELARLARNCPVGVISGRDLADVQARVGVPGIWYAGSHGFELVGPDGQGYQNDTALVAAPSLDRVTSTLTDRLGSFPGVLLERKRFAVAVHHRNVEADLVDDVVAAVYAVAAGEPGLRATSGRKVTELQLDVDWDKGRALSWVLDHVSESDDLLPIYIGDDLTDEDAFDAIEGRGFGIVVRHDEGGDRRSSAQYAVDGPAQVHELLQRIADLVGSDPRTEPPPEDPWTVFFEGYDAPSERLREALCTVGNGAFATRGCAPECRAGPLHYPGTYAAGIFNRLREDKGSTVIDNESLVNLPNWLPLTFRVDDGPWFDIDSTELLDYRQYLDLRRALFVRRLRIRDRAGHTTSIVQRRFFAMHLPHVCALETTISAEDWSGRLEVRSEIDGAVENTLVERYRELASRHLEPLEARELAADSVLIAMHTTRSRIPIAMAARTSVWRDHERQPAEYRLIEGDGRIGHDITVALEAGQSVTAEKIATVFTGRDFAVSEPADEAARWLARVGRFEEALDGHVLAWARLWDSLGIELEGHGHALRIVRFHLLQLLQTVSPNTADLDAGVPARGLHGEAYRGHIFWDELFVFPVLNLRLPTLTRSLLRYRYRRLREARRAAREAGRTGAMFPWQSGSDGREESQQLHLNPISGRWNPDPSRRQMHTGIAVAYNVWQYYQVTGDLEFLIEFGAEMLIEIARFYASLAEFDADRSRYIIRGVIGPDEFHTGYLDAPYDGIDNNAYTNVMTVWVLLRAIDALAVIPRQIRSDLTQALGLPTQEITRWEDISRRMFVPFHDGVISQFEGYGDLAELEWEAYGRRYGNIQRLDRILEAEDDDVNRYRASKQADVLMLFYLLSADELRDLLQRLGYSFTAAAIPRTIDYYIARTSHGSTLSSVVHSWVLARGNRDRAMEFFDRVLASDVADIQGGTTSEGIHLAAMAGSVDLVQRCFSGLEVRGDRLVFSPNWPSTLGTLEFPVFYRGHRLRLKINGRQIEVRAAPGNQPSIQIECRGRVAQLLPGSTVYLD